MLNNTTGFQRIYIATEYTDLRRGIDGLASIIKFNFQLDPYEKDILFLFCGRRSDRIKGLVWEGNGFLLLFYKRLELSGFSWSRTKKEALAITPEQYRALMQGLEIVSRHPIREIYPQPPCKALCKTEKIKNLFIFTVLDRPEVIHRRTLSHSFNYGVLTSSKLLCG